jgi:hypothetical protein
MSRETSDTPSANPRMILEEQWPIRPTEQRQAAYSSRRYRHRDRRPGEDFAERSRVRLVSVCRQYRDASVSVGARATDVLYSSAMYSPAEAHAIGLVSEVVAAEALLDRAHAIARERGSQRPAAFAGIKSLLCAPIAESMARREAVSIAGIVDIWYSEPTWSNLRGITIR